MQTVARSQFTTIKTEGAILPADLLQRLNEGKLDGLKPEQYHLSPNERLNEAITRAWNRCQGIWQGFQEQREKLAPTDSGTSLTRERWLLILFQELGYGRLPFQSGGLEMRPKAEQTDLSPGTRYPISHVWEHVPIHLVTFRQELDKRDPASKRSPHSLVQEFLTRSDDHLWGIVSNGLSLRVLRDNVSLTRAAYLEFDLEAMMTGAHYADFSLLWLICHQSRVEIGADPDAAALPSNCWLEIWSQLAAEQGTRALEALRDGVQEAIAALGRGFLAHPANTTLRQHLGDGTLTRQDYYRQLLRLVYRLIFLFVAEDRDLLMHPEATVVARQRYSDHYSVGRLRQLAGSRRGGPHPDLYRAFRLVCFQLRTGYTALGLPALGSFLFSARATADLDEADIANSDWLTAIRALAFTFEKQVRRPVDYKNLGTEELGSVYESLLELHPQLNLAAATFHLNVVAGSERKTTGSYYTPASLINSLLDTALEPVVADRLQTATQHAPRTTPNLEALSQTLLAIRVVDPACGSGHFLIAAARRLARHLARIQTGDDEPGPEAVRHALREVVQHCIYGVDINEMSVELCKVGLWLETIDPGRPLSFLDKNIQCGNSLIGATPALLAQGIPDEAFTPITGDDKSYASEYRKQNSKEKGQLRLFGAGMQPWQRLGNLAQALTELDRIETGTLAGVAQQENAYAAYVGSSDYAFNKLWADAWCAAFMWRKQGEHASPPGFAYPITESVFRQIERNPHAIPGWMRQEIERLAGQYQFLHWHLAFPQVFTPVGGGGIGNGGVGGERVGNRAAPDSPTGWTGGFDVVLGNPPWERIKLQEKEWFASRDDAIATAPNAAARRNLIAALPKTNPALYADFEADKRKAEGESLFVRNSGKYPLCGRGDVNTYTIFAELSRHVLHEAGRAGIIVPSGIATDDTTKYFFQDLMDQASLVSLYDFENRAGLFPAVDSRMKFCLLTLTGPVQPATEGAQFIFFAHQTSDLKDSDRRFTLSAADIALLNPNTRTCPIFRSKRDAELTKTIYRQVPILINERFTNGNIWNIEITRMFHGSDDSHLFVMNTDCEDLFLLYEAKCFWHFDHRFASYQNTDYEYVMELQKRNPGNFIQTRYNVPKSAVPSKFQKRLNTWYLSYRIITNATNERTIVSSIIPECGLLNSANAIYGVSARESLYLTGNFNSFVQDFICRQTMGGTNLHLYIFQQLPILPPSVYKQFQQTYALLWANVFELTYTAYDLQPFAQDCGYFGPPFRWDEERRFLLRCELDAAYFHLYGIQRDDLAYIMDTFPIVRRKDEAAYGEYRTRRVTLEIYDAMAEAMHTGQPYQTRLDPPPAHPDAAHPWDETYLGPYRDPATWWVTPVSLTFTTPTELLDAERECLFTCALRFDGHRYGSETNLDHETALERFVQTGKWPDDPLAQYTLFFWLQRSFAKWGHSFPTLDGSYWRAFRSLFLQVVDTPIPAEYQLPEYVAKWQSRYAPNQAQWVALIRQLDQQTTYQNEEPTTMDEGKTWVRVQSIYARLVNAANEDTVLREPRPVWSIHDTPSTDTLTLQPPPTSGKSKRLATSNQSPVSQSLSLQSPLLTDFAPPKGERGQRLKQVMALAQPKNTAELQTLVAALGDDDGNIRWLAGSSLSRLPAATLLPVLRAFIRQPLTPITQEEVRRVLRLLGDLSDDVRVQADLERLLDVLTE